MWPSVKVLNDFNILTLKKIFWKTKTFFKTKIETASFLYKTAMSKANFKTNRMVSSKWTYHKERSFASSYFIFLNFVSVYETLTKRWFDVPTTQIFIFLLSVSAGVLFDGALSLWISLKKFDSEGVSYYSLYMKYNSVNVEQQNLFTHKQHLNLFEFIRIGEKKQYVFTFITKRKIERNRT